MKLYRREIGWRAPLGEPFTIVNGGVGAEDQQRDDPVQRYRYAIVTFDCPILRKPGPPGTLQSRTKNVSNIDPVAGPVI
jgi:hypothetical protein